LTSPPSCGPIATAKILGSKQAASPAIPPGGGRWQQQYSGAAVSAYRPRSRRQKSISVHDEKCVSRPTNKRRADDSTHQLPPHG